VRVIFNGVQENLIYASVSVILNSCVNYGICKCIQPTDSTIHEPPSTLELCLLLIDIELNEPCKISENSVRKSVNSNPESRYDLNVIMYD
jgi:hypothetical protein